jgi:flagellin
MSLVVNTNTASVNAYNNLSKTTHAMSKTFARISSGLRITSAADDAAGLAVSENLDAEGRSIEAAKRNVNDGVGVLQVAEGATGEVGNIIKRMRELAVQASSETLGDDERAYVNDEFEQLSAEVGRIASTTNFNGVALTDGADTTLDVQVGIDGTANDRLTISLGDLTTSTLGIDTGSIDLSTAAGAQGALTTLDDALETVNGYRSSYGAMQNRLEASLSSLSTYGENVSAAKSRILDADFAKESAEMSKLQVMQQAGIAVLGQANGITGSALRLIG